MASIQRPSSSLRPPPSHSRRLRDKRDKRLLNQSRTFAAYAFHDVKIILFELPERIVIDAWSFILSNRTLNLCKNYLLKSDPRSLIQKREREREREREEEIDFISKTVLASLLSSKGEAKNPIRETITLYFLPL